MANTQDITRRIKSVNNTKKITKAMEMVAAAKMRRAIEAVLKTRTYANLSWETVLNLSRGSSEKDELHPLLAKRTRINKVAMILISSNRGLCGGYNTAIINKAHESVKKHGEAPTDFIIIGKKGRAVHKYYGYKMEAEFPKEDVISEVKEVLSISKMVLDDFLNKKYDKILVAYTDYVSSAKQIPRIKQLLPVDIEAQEEYLGKVDNDSDKGLQKQKESNIEYKFEPSPTEVLNDMIPRLIEVQLFQALLEANASEHSARMTAMHQATDAATDMVAELTLFYNKARQASITAEIAEISAGANALAE